MEDNQEVVILEEEHVEQPTENNTVAKQPEQNEQPQYSDAELKAMEQGWNPDKEAYEKANPGKKWRPADDYVERGELYDTIHSLKRTVDSQKEKFETLEKTYQKVREHTKAQVEKELRQMLREATELGDVDAINRITDEIVNVKTKADFDDKPAQNNTGISDDVVREVKSFEQRNAIWFTRDPADFEKYAISTDAFQYEDTLARTRPDIPLNQRFELVEKYIKSKYPTKFVNPNQNRPTPVASASPVSAPTKKEIRISDLPAHHQRVLRTLKQESHKQYIADLKAIGEI